MKTVRATLCLLSCLLAGGAATAATLFDNGGPDQAWGTQMSEVRVAEDFTLASSVSLSNIRFWSLQSSASDYAGSVSWAVFSDVAGQPGGLVLSGLAAVSGVATGLSSGFGYGEYVYDIPVSFSLGAGSYWLGLHNGPLSNLSPSEMLWSTTGAGLGSTGLYTDLGGWVDTGNHHAFRLDGSTVSAVPEPELAGLFLAGLLTLGALRRRLAPTPAASDGV